MTYDSLYALFIEELVKIAPDLDPRQSGRTTSFRMTSNSIPWMCSTFVAAPPPAAPKVGRGHPGG